MARSTDTATTGGKTKWREGAVKKEKTNMTEAVQTFRRSTANNPGLLGATSSYRLR
jgi:hypothetical protein